MIKNLNVVAELLIVTDAMSSFNNQLKILKNKFLDSNIAFVEGHQFTITSALISHCDILIAAERTQDVILLDDYQNPVLIKNLVDLKDNIIDLYQSNLNSYYTEYNELLKTKGEVKDNA
jgi:hypothetical protein